MKIIYGVLYKMMSRILQLNNHGFLFLIIESICFCYLKNYISKSNE